MHRLSPIVFVGASLPASSNSPITFKSAAPFQLSQRFLFMPRLRLCEWVSASTCCGLAMAVVNTLSNGWRVRPYDPRLHGVRISVFVTDSTFGWNLIPGSKSFHDVVVEDSGGRLRMRVLFQTGGTFVGIESMVRLLLHGRTFAKTAAAPMREALLPRKQCHYGEWERQQERILHPDVYLPTTRATTAPTTKPLPFLLRPLQSLPSFVHPSTRLP